MKSRPATKYSLITVAAVALFLSCVPIVHATASPSTDNSPGTGDSVHFAVTRIPTTVTRYELNAAWPDNFSPAQSDLSFCNWLDGMPDVPVLLRSSPNYPGTKCNPVINGKDFGLLESPQNRHLQLGVLRVARLDPKTHGVAVGPVLLSFALGSDSWPSAAAADGWIWLFVPSPNGAHVLRFSMASGELVQKISILKMSRPIISANDDGLFLGLSNQGAITGDVYFVGIGSSHVQLLQSTKDFTFMMQTSAHAMTAVQARDAAGPFVEYRFTE